MTEVIVHNEGHVRVLRFSNPPRNLMTSELSGHLLYEVGKAAEDESVRILIFASAHPNTFIQHYDVAEILAMGEIVRSGASMGDGGRADTPFYALCDAVDALPKPTIAAINGTCMGGGYEFALCCDIRIARAGDYPIGLPETRLGIFPGGGGTQRLDRLAGTGAALNLILRGLTPPPEEAKAAGLIHEVVTEDVDKAAMEIAAGMAEFPIARLAAVKRLVKTAASVPLADGLAAEARAFVELVAASDEARRAMEDYVAGGQDPTGFS